MSSRNILAAVARADLIVCAALRIGRLALCIGLGMCVGRWMIRRSERR